MPEPAAKIYKLRDGKKHTKLGLQVFKKCLQDNFYNQVKSSLNSHEIYVASSTPYDWGGAGVARYLEYHFLPGFHGVFFHLFVLNFLTQGPVDVAWFLDISMLQKSEVTC